MFKINLSKTINNETILYTEGLVQTGRPEIKAKINDSYLIKDAEIFLTFICNYLLKENIFLKSGETVAYGYWLVKFIFSDDGSLHTFEYLKDATDFIPGIDLTLQYWKSQHEISKELKTDFIPPRPDTKVAISKGVLEGDYVQGIRYPSPPHMSGWWLTTDLYDGNIKLLKVIHLYHVTSARPDLVKYLALPYGFRFNTEKNTIIFDQKILEK